MLVSNQALCKFLMHQLHSGGHGQADPPQKICNHPMAELANQGAYALAHHKYMRLNPNWSFRNCRQYYSFLQGCRFLKRTSTRHSGPQQTASHVFAGHPHIREFSCLLKTVQNGWNKFFGMLMWPIIVRTICYNCWQTKSFIIATHKVIGCRFACAIRAIWFVGCGFVKPTVIKLQTAKDFICRHMDKSETVTKILAGTLKVAQRIDQQCVSAIDICLYKLIRRRNRTINMAFRGKMNNRARMVRIEYLTHHLTIVISTFKFVRFLCGG